MKAFHTAGFLGTEYGPFMITDPADAASAVRPPADLGDARFKSRRKLYEQLLADEPVYQFGGDYQRESLIRSLDAGDRLLNSPSAKAFDLSLEPKKSFDVYVTDIETADETYAMTVNAASHREAVQIARNRLKFSPLLRAITHAAAVIDIYIGLCGLIIKLIEIGLFGVEGALGAGHALTDDLGRFIDQNRHNA